MAIWHRFCFFWICYGTYSNPKRSTNCSFASSLIALVRTLWQMEINHENVTFTEGQIRVQGCLNICITYKMICKYLESLMKFRALVFLRITMFTRVIVVAHVAVMKFTQTSYIPRSGDIMNSPHTYLLKLLGI